MMMLQFTPLAAMCAIVAATVLRSIAIRQSTGDHPLAFLSATGVQRLAGLCFAISTIVLIVASFIAAMQGQSRYAIAAAILALVGASVVIIAQVQMGRAWRIGVREGDAPLFVSHGLFRFSRNPIFVGMMLVGAAAALAASTYWAWAALMVFVVSCAVQVRIEERHLEASFGQAYREFCAKVPRWIAMGGQA
jgi:protein-S-isoprenylcysteine O-methyltransferase Ste14